MASQRMISQGGGAATTPTHDTLILAAHAAELGPLVTWLQGDEAPAGAAHHIATEVVGVGLGEAGAGTASALARHRPRRVVLIGSAGAYPDAGLDLGALVLARDVHLVDSAVVEGRAAIPEPMKEVPVADAGLSDSLSACAAIAARVGVATTLAITTDDGLAQTLGQAGPWQVENLEAFAVALACQRSGVPFAAVLAITNRVGSAGRAEWRVQHKVAAEQTAQVLQRWCAG